MVKKTPKRRLSSARPGGHVVVKLSPETDAARDEGPRLIPLKEPLPREFSQLGIGGYVALADHALHIWKHGVERKAKK